MIDINKNLAIQYVFFNTIDNLLIHAFQHLDPSNRPQCMGTSPQEVPRLIEALRMKKRN